MGDAHLIIHRMNRKHLKTLYKAQTAQMTDNNEAYTCEADVIYNSVQFVIFKNNTTSY